MGTIKLVWASLCGENKSDNTSESNKNLEYIEGWEKSVEDLRYCDGRRSLFFLNGDTVDTH